MIFHIIPYYGSPSFVSVPDDDAFQVETEGLRRMVERQRLVREEREREQAKLNSKHAKHHGSKKGKGHSGKQKHAHGKGTNMGPTLRMRQQRAPCNEPKSQCT